MRELYKCLRKMKRQIIDDCLDNIDNYCKGNSNKGSSVRRVLLSYRSQFTKPTKAVVEKFIYCNIPFVHKIIEKIGIREILKFREVNAYLPHKAQKFKIRTTFSYGPTLGRKIFNYNATLRNLNNSDFNTLTCDCGSTYAPFVYEPHGHVHTGQLDIIQNHDLRNIMARGAKFRLTPRISKRKIWETLHESLLTLKKKLVMFIFYTTLILDSLPRKKNKT